MHSHQAKTANATFSGRYFHPSSSFGANELVPQKTSHTVVLICTGSDVIFAFAFTLECKYPKGAKKVLCLTMGLLVMSQSKNVQRNISIGAVDINVLSVKYLHHFLPYKI